jgi:hypothetical protein
MSAFCTRMRFEESMSMPSVDGPWPSSLLRIVTPSMRHVARIADVHRPEAGAAHQQAAADLDVGRIEHLHQARTARVVVRSPAQAARLVLLAQGPVAVPEHLAVAVDGAFADDAAFFCL